MTPKSIAMSTVGGIVLLLYLFVFRGNIDVTETHNDDVDRSGPYMLARVEGDELYMEVSEQKLSDVVLELAAQSGQNFIPDQSLKEKVSFLLEKTLVQDAPFSVFEFLDLIMVKSDGQILVRRKNENDRFSSYQSQNLPETQSRRENWQKKKAGRKKRQGRRYNKRVAASQPEDFKSKPTRAIPQTTANIPGAQKTPPKIRQQNRSAKKARQPTQNPALPKVKLRKKLSSSTGPQSAKVPISKAPTKLPTARGNELAALSSIDTSLANSRQQQLVSPKAAKASRGITGSDGLPRFKPPLEGQLFGLPKLQLYRSTTHLTVAWGQEDNKIGEYRKIPFVPDIFDSKMYSTAQIKKMLDRHAQRVIKGEHLPSGFAVDKDGWVYLPDTHKQRIMVFDQRGQLKKSIKTVRNKDDNMGRYIFDLIVSPQKKLFFVDTYDQDNTAMRVISAQGQFVTDIPIPADLQELLSITDDVVFYGSFAENVAITDLTGKYRYNNSQIEAAMILPHYLVSLPQNGVINRSTEQLIYSFSDRGEPTAVIGEDKDGYLYLQYGNYGEDGLFEIRKISSAGSHVAVIDMVSELAPRIYAESMINRTVALNPATGSIYQIHATMKRGVTFYRYSSVN